jgi:hypothetical protein
MTTEQHLLGFMDTVGRAECSCGNFTCHYHNCESRAEASKQHKEHVIDEVMKGLKVIALVS